MSAESESGLTNIINSTEQSVCQNSINRSHHCRTCTCSQSIGSISETLRYQRLNSDTATNSFQSSSDDRSFESEIRTTVSGDSKPVNFKDEYVIYDEEQLTRSRTDFSGASSSSVANCTVNIRVPVNQGILRNDNTSPIDEKDIPVIYDINQLNVGSSPVLEDNPIIQSAESTVK
ncbi:hypothetical protein EVAR_81230_1 [Eumeta japonica]|uniref:Uncharacterized protein n=1 Tax=Eumeta variegata TaxID=151549 RepID=A0A4C1V0Y8_EUMVA|nr:hypothetical protein EVAR_81230_1 [Eumeta japonica]